MASLKYMFLLHAIQSSVTKKASASENRAFICHNSEFLTEGSLSLWVTPRFKEFNQPGMGQAKVLLATDACEIGAHLKSPPFQGSMKGHGPAVGLPVGPRNTKDYC